MKWWSWMPGDARIDVIVEKLYYFHVLSPVHRMLRTAEECSNWRLALAVSASIWGLNCSIISSIFYIWLKICEENRISTVASSDILIDSTLDKWSDEIRWVVVGVDLSQENDFYFLYIIAVVGVTPSKYCIHESMNNQS